MLGWETIALRPSADTIAQAAPQPARRSMRDPTLFSSGVKQVTGQEAVTPFHFQRATAKSCLSSSLSPAACESLC